MKRTVMLLALVLGLAANVAPAQWREGGEEIPESEWSKSVGDFAAMLLATDDPEQFFEMWEQPPSPAFKPEITTTSTATRGDTVVAVIVFTGCAANAEGNCESEADFRVLYPDGSIYAEHEGAELWTDKPAPASPHLQLSVANLGLRIEDDDPFGTYRIEAVVRDRVADRRLELVQTIDVVDGGP